MLLIEQHTEKEIIGPGSKTNIHPTLIRPYYMPVQVKHYKRNTIVKKCSGDEGIE